MSVSEAVRLFLHCVVVPLELKVPNKETIQAMSEANDIISKRLARFSSAIELKKTTDDKY